MTRGEFNPISMENSGGVAGKSLFPRVFLALILGALLVSGALALGIQGAAAQQDDSNESDVDVVHKQLDSSTTAKNIEWNKEQQVVRMTIEGNGRIVIADNIRFEEEESAPLQKFRISGEERIEADARTAGSKQSITIVTQNRMVLLEDGQGFGEFPDIPFAYALVMVLVVISLVIGLMTYKWVRTHKEEPEEAELR